MVDAASLRKEAENTIARVELMKKGGGPSLGPELEGLFRYFASRLLACADTIEQLERGLQDQQRVARAAIVKATDACNAAKKKHVALPGYFCAGRLKDGTTCRVFNGDVREYRTHCRVCGAPRTEGPPPP